MNMVGGKKITVDLFDVGARLFDFDKREIGTCLDSPCAIARACNDRPVVCYILPFGGELETKKSYLERMKPKYFSPESGSHIIVGPALYLRELFCEKLGQDWKQLLNLFDNNYYYIKATALDVHDYEEAESIFRKVMRYAIQETN